MEGYEVRTAETHGMAQRGGSVASYFRFGTNVEGPLIPRGKTDVVLAFEASEAVRSFNYASSKTIFLVNDKIIIPPMIHQMGMEYPDINKIRNFLKEVSDNIYFINADEMASSLENPRVMNVIMLGVLFGSKNVPLKEGSLISAILNFIPKKFHDVNRKAFQIGIEEGIKVREDYNEQSILCRG